MTFAEFIQIHFANHEQTMQSETDSRQKKYYLKCKILKVKETLTTNFLKKIKAGKINQEHSQYLIDFLSVLIKAHNKIQIYDVKNDIVTPRNLSVFPEVTLSKTLNKGDCQKNLEQLERLK